LKKNDEVCYIIGLLLCMPVFAAPQGDSGPPADILAVRNIEIIFNTAGSVLPSKDLDMMMSLFADDAVLTDTAHDNKVYRGKGWQGRQAPIGESETSRREIRSILVQNDQGVNEIARGSADLPLKKQTLPIRSGILVRNWRGFAGV
jgi:hypothetical protein